MGKNSKKIENMNIIEFNKKEALIKSIQSAIDELNVVVEEMDVNLKNSNKTIYYSLLILIDELDYIMKYIEKIEGWIDLSIFDTAKRLSDTLVNLIGYRKDILFKLIDVSCKFQEYVLKWKRLASTINPNEGSLEGYDFIGEINKQEINEV